MRNIERKPIVPHAAFPLSISQGMRLRDVPRLSKTEIGKWVARIREDMGMTQEKFAEALGVLRSQVGKWETGVNKPDHENTRKIEQLLADFQKRQTPMVVSAHNGKHHEGKEMEEEMIRLYRLLSVIERAELLVDLKKRITPASQESAAPSKA